MEFETIKTTESLFTLIKFNGPDHKYVKYLENRIGVKVIGLYEYRIINKKKFVLARLKYGF